MATIKELKELALHAVRGTAPANYTAETVDEALRGELCAMCDSINNFQRNKYDIFEIPEVFSLTFDEFSIPVNLFNSKFLNPELFMISFVVLVISNLFYLGALDKILAKNLPKICGFITSIIFSFLSIIALVFDILIRTQALPFTYQSSDTLLTYILLGVCTFLIACAILQMASAFYSIFKTRK